MKRFLLYLFIFAVAIYFGLQIVKDPGYALFAYGQWTMEMPLWFLAVVFVLLFFLMQLGCNIVSFILSGCKRLGGYLENWQQQRAQKLTNQGLLQLAEGNWAKAESLLVKAASPFD